MRAYMSRIILLSFVLFTLINASPAAHIQKNVATIIGSNVEVNIDVPSDLAIRPIIRGDHHNNTDDNRETSRIVLDIKSNVEGIGDNKSNDTENALVRLLDRTIDVVNEEENGKEYEETEVVERVRENDKVQGNESGKKKSDVWKQYMVEREEKWKRFKKSDGTDGSSEVNNNNNYDRLINILKAITQGGNYIVEIVISILTKDYANLFTNIMKVIEIILNYFLNGK